MVGSMIRRSVRNRYRQVLYRLPHARPQAPVVLYPNHHGWMDGYLMFHLITKLRLVCVDWIEEFDAFPLFARVGGMRFAPGDRIGRVATVRNTINLMRKGRSLVLFAEGVLHRPPEVWPFGKAIEVIAKHVPGVTFAPVAIYQEMSLHERPEAWLSLGTSHLFISRSDCQARLNQELIDLRKSVHQGDPFEILAAGTLSVNERMDMRRLLQKR